MEILVLFAVIGICIVAGFLTRGHDSETDTDNVIITFFRGLAVMGGIVTFVGFILGILSLFIDFKFLK